MYSLSLCPDEQGTVVDSFGAFLVEGARFSSHEEYPIIEQNMIAQELPVDIMPFNKALTYRGDLSKTFVCTFSPDETFERVRRNPKKYLDFFKRTAGLIGFDFSIHSDMPIIKQKAQIYDNLALTYYYGNNGIPVIPNVRSGIDELTPEFLECIPKSSTIAIGTHGFMKEMREKYEWYCFLDEVINTIHPKSIVVYGTLSSKMFDDFKESTNIVCYPSWISEGYLKDGGGLKMATKGASNHYGNARGGRQGHITAHTGFAWAKGFNKSTLADHANRHGGTGGRTKYVANAVAFANRVDRVNHLSYIRKDGTTVKYSKKTNEFAVIDKHGIVKTYFKPANGIQKYLKDKEEHK